MCDCEKKCWCWESASTIRKKICVDIAWYDPDDVCNNKLVIKYADSCQVILWIDNCETVVPVLPSAPTNGYVTDSGWWAYDCGNPILWWTASPTSWVTYTIKEWATTIATWVSETTYTVTWAIAWVHSYTVEAVNGVWSSSVLTINTFVIACLSIPNNVTNAFVTDSWWGSYDCWNPILSWTASSWATSYDIFEWAALIWNTVSTTFTVAWASVWSHTYSIRAKNWVGSASWVNVSVTVIACWPAVTSVPWSFLADPTWASWGTHWGWEWSGSFAWLWAALQAANPSFGQCFSWAWFIVPTTKTYTITYNLVTNWTGSWPWSADIYAGVEDPFVWWWPLLRSANVPFWDTAPRSVSYTTGVLTAWTCYVALFNINRIWWPSFMPNQGVMTNFTIV
jgi:hypothetical protein